MVFCLSLRRIGQPLIPLGSANSRVHCLFLRKDTFLLSDIHIVALMARPQSQPSLRSLRKAKRGLAGPFAVAAAMSDDVDVMTSTVKILLDPQRSWLNRRQTPTPTA